MENLIVLKENGAKTNICYIADRTMVEEKLHPASSPRYIPVDPQLAASILQDYRLFTAISEKSTPAYVFASGNAGDWYLAQVEIKRP